MHFTGSGTGSDVIDVGNRLFKALTDYTVSGHLPTNAEFSDIKVLPIFWLNKSSRKNRNQSATVKLDQYFDLLNEKSMDN